MQRSFLGDYEPVKRLGSGAMGEVYLCLHRPSQIYVAVKVIAERFANDEEFMETVRENFQLVHGLKHPNIASCNHLEQCPETGEFMLIMEFVEGQELSEAFHGGATWEEVVPVVDGVAAALDFAHSRGIIHRDVKPENAMLLDDGSVKLLDLGVAAPTGEDGNLAGTPGYMAPEIWENKAPVPGSDQFSLGVLAYELLVGERPFVGDTLHRIAMVTRREPAPDLPMDAGVPRSAEAALKKALSKAPGDRHESCSEFARLFANHPKPGISWNKLLLTVALPLLLTGCLLAGLLFRFGSARELALERQHASIMAAIESAKQDFEVLQSEVRGQYGTALATLQKTLEKEGRTPDATVVRKAEERFEQLGSIPRIGPSLPEELRSAREKHLGLNDKAFQDYEERLRVLGESLPEGLKSKENVFPVTLRPGLRLRIDFESDVVTSEPNAEGNTEQRISAESEFRAIPLAVSAMEKTSGIIETGGDFPPGSELRTLSGFLAKPLEAMTVGFWIRPNLLEGQVLTLDGLDLSLVFDGAMFAQVGGDRRSKVSVPRDRWSHVAMSVSRDGEVAMALDGQPQVKFAFSASMDVQAFAGLTFGGSGGAAEMDAWLDEVTVHDRVLSSEDIQRLYRRSDQLPDDGSPYAIFQPEGPGEIHFGDGIKLSFAWVPPGGTPQKFKKGFWLARTEVSQEVFDQAYFLRRKFTHPGPRNPAGDMEAWRADAWCAWVSSKFGIHARLPSEKELMHAIELALPWETIRGDAKTLEPYAWTKTNSGAQPQPVGTSEADLLGCYDLMGNAWELTSSPAPEVKGGHWPPRKAKGVSWNAEWTYGNQKIAHAVAANKNWHDLGFRVVVTPAEAGQLAEWMGNFDETMQQLARDNQIPSPRDLYISLWMDWDENENKRWGLRLSNPQFHRKWRSGETPLRVRDAGAFQRLALPLHHLNVIHCRIDDCEPLVQPSLRDLLIAVTNVKSLEPLRHSNLISLSAGLCAANRLEPLKDVRNLERLNLRMGGYKDLHTLSDLKNLEDLSLEQVGKFEDQHLEFLPPSLKRLKINFTSVTDIRPLLDMPNLEWINQMPLGTLEPGWGYAWEEGNERFIEFLKEVQERHKDVPFLKEIKSKLSQIQYCLRTGGPPEPPNNPAEGGDSLFIPLRMSWEDANTFARAMGGRLPTIKSKGYAQWIRKCVPCEYNYWLGGRMTDDGWAWTNGEPFDYQLWKNPGDRESREPGLFLLGDGYGTPDMRYGTAKNREMFVVEWDK